MFLETCNTLSRLKGIETFLLVQWIKNYISLQYAFPFEGNRNVVVGVDGRGLLGHLQYAFPFEGNRNSLTL